MTFGSLNDDASSLGSGVCASPLLLPLRRAIPAMWLRLVARAGEACGIVLAFSAVLAGGTVGAADLTDATALALVRKHCGACHSRNPTHPVFSPAPKGIVFDTMEDLRKYAAQVLEQAVEDRTMPLGNETDMTDDEREALGRWVKALK
jgi:uncharacterized membrane protein